MLDRERWQRLLATFFSFAAAVAPVLAFAQTVPPPGAPPPDPDPTGNSRGGFPWLLVILAVVVVFYLASRYRRRGTMRR
jgi:hypothetical protein